MIPFLDELTPAAQAIQAVNTIVNEDGVLVGHNTDGCGYTQNLRRNGIEVAGKKIVLLGGAAEPLPPSPSRRRWRARRKSLCSTSGMPSGPGWSRG